MKIATESISIEDTTQASFPPFTRGYNATPTKMVMRTRDAIESIVILQSFSTSDIVTALHSFKDLKQINLLLTTPIIDIEFVAGVRALRTLVSILDEENESLYNRKVNFSIEITPLEDTAQELLFAQFAQIDTIVCDEKDIETLKLLLNHLPTLPIDTLFGSKDLEKVTNHIVEEVYSQL